MKITNEMFKKAKWNIDTILQKNKPTKINVDNLGLFNNFEQYLKHNKHSITKLMFTVNDYWIRNTYNQNLKTKFEKSNGYWKTWTYDSNRNLTKQEDSLKTWCTWEYNDSSHNDSSHNDSSHNENNKITKFESSLGNYKTWKYDQHNNIIEIIDSDGIHKKFTYDSNQNLIKEEDLLEKCYTNYIYSNKNILTKKINSDGYWWTYEYNYQGQISKETFGKDIYKYGTNIYDNITDNLKIFNPKENNHVYKK